MNQGSHSNGGNPAVETGPATTATLSETSLLSRIRRTNTQIFTGGVNKSPALLRRPKSVEWISTREERQIPVYIVEDTSGDVYVVTDDVAAALGRKAKDAVLHEACSLEGATFLVPCKVDGGNAAVTLAQAIEHSRGAWVQVEWSKPAGHYTHEIKEYQADKGPVWDVRTFDEVLEASLEGKVISTVDHVVIQRILHAKT